VEGKSSTCEYFYSFADDGINHSSVFEIIDTIMSCLFAVAWSCVDGW
jgi:hypothetical protein